MDIKSSDKIAEFYNAFSDKQVKTGKNLRHYSLYKEIKKAGLKRNHKVLEIGCGIGTFTELLARYLVKGKVVATDISDKSIEISRVRTRNLSNLDFLVSDMSDFSYPEHFDFIVFLDVLEHIPIAQHAQLFQTISKVVHEDSIVFIHIPHPKWIELKRKVSPESLQIIDQTVYSDALIDSAYKAGFYLHSLQSYTLFNDLPDYQKIIFKVNKDYETVKPKSKLNIVFRKYLLKLFGF